MATAVDPNIAKLDELGGVLCRLGNRIVSITWHEECGGFYVIDLHRRGGGFDTGMGDTPSEALAAAEAKAATLSFALTAVRAGFAVDA